MLPQQGTPLRGLQPPPQIPPRAAQRLLPRPTADPAAMQITIGTAVDARADTLSLSVSVSVSMSVSCSASHVRPFAWRPMPPRQSYHVLCPAAEANAPGRDAEAFACSIVRSRGDAGAQCLGLHFSGWSFAAGEQGAQQGDSEVDLLRAWR